MHLETWRFIDFINGPVHKWFLRLGRRLEARLLANPNRFAIEISPPSNIVVREEGTKLLWQRSETEGIFSDEGISVYRPNVMAHWPFEIALNVRAIRRYWGERCTII